MNETEEAPLIEDVETKEEVDEQQVVPEEAFQEEVVTEEVVPEEITASDFVAVKASFQDKKSLDSHLLEMLKDETTESEMGEVVNEIEANVDQGNNTGVVDHEDSGEDDASGEGVEDKLIDEEDEYDKEENDEEEDNEKNMLQFEAYVDESNDGPPLGKKKKKTKKVVMKKKKKKTRVT